MTDRYLQQRELDCFVLDALVNDVESVDIVLRTLNSDSELGWTDAWGRAFNRGEVVASMVRLVRRDLVRAYSAAGDDLTLSALDPRAMPTDLREAYFGLTDRGRIAHATWAAGDSDGSIDASSAES